LNSSRDPLNSLPSRRSRDAEASGALGDGPSTQLRPAKKVIVHRPDHTIAQQAEVPSAPKLTIAAPVEILLGEATFGIRLVDELALTDHRRNFSFSDPPSIAVDSMDSIRGVPVNLVGDPMLTAFEVEELDRPKETPNYVTPKLILVRV